MSPTTEPIRILLADDSEVGRYVIATTLRRAGFEVREVSDGIEALHEVKTNPPDLAVLDVKMPGLNGLELCARIKADPEISFVPVLLLSATFLGAEARVEGLDLGADAYLTQPVEAPVLIASIRSLLRTRAAERAERRASAEWRVTFDAIGDAVALVDPDGMIHRCNLAFAALNGVSSESVVGHRLEEIDPQLAGVTHQPVPENPAIFLLGREFTYRVDHLPGPDTSSQAVVTLRDVTADRELARERERILQRERLISTTLQEALVPGRLPTIRGLALGAKYVLGEADVVVGGDWFDVIPRPEGAWLVIGDNTGHGVITTARAVQLRNNLRLLADEGYGPSDAMSRLSEVLQTTTAGEIATAMIVALDIAGGVGHVVSAGHPPALLLRSGQEPQRIGEGTGPVLGFPSANAIYREVTFELRAGDTAVLYTDGLVERRGELIDVGIERLVAAIDSVEPAAMPEQAFEALLPRAPTDDAAILVARLI